MAKGFGGFPGGNMQALLQQAQKMQKDMQRAQAEAESYIAEGRAGGGAVVCVVNGKNEVVSVSIKPEAVADVDLLNDMVRIAANDALNQIRKNTETKLNQVTGGMSIPGLSS
jgi:DNA-binding YbaB/EbfC family protein